MTNRRPAPDESAEYYHNYIRQVEGDDILRALEVGMTEALAFLKSIDREKWAFAYAPGKWTLADVLMHVIDGERIFAYRALRIARNDTTPLPGFDQDQFVPYAEAGKREPESIVAEYAAVRNATLHLFHNFSDDMWRRRGIASTFPVTPLALAYIIAGHEQHHLRVIRERYLV